MLQPAIQVLLYGIFAGLSALAFAATIAVMQTGRLKALAFGTGFVVAQLFTCSLFVGLGVAATGSSRNSHPEIQFTVELVLALAMLALARRIHRRPARESAGSSDRTRELLERLSRLRFFTMLLAGLLLGLGGPKRLLLTAFAATAITTAGVSDSREAALVIWYVAVATVLVWVPVILFVLLGQRTIALMTDAQERIGRRQPKVTVYALLLLAAVFIADAITVI